MGIGLIVKGVWAVFYIVWGALLHGLHEDAVVFTLLIVGTAFILALAVLFEYRRAVLRLGRLVAPAPQPEPKIVIDTTLTNGWRR